MNTLQRYWWLAGLAIALAVVLFSPLASPHPDGLERVAQDQGFIGQAREAPFQILTGYLLPGVHNQTLATILAGLLGTVVVFAVGYGLAWLLRRSRSVRQS
jgi:ABC-type spermidine/putrescine transport system permease subunit I